VRRVHDDGVGASASRSAKVPRRAGYLRAPRLPLAADRHREPTHIAIAFATAGRGWGARVLAKGKGALAEVIRDIAPRERHRHHRRHSPRAPHVQARAGGGYVPKETFKAVATVLAHVYKLQQRR